LKHQSVHTYPGSGIDWVAHLKEHGKDVTTTVLLETEDKSKLRSQGIHYSNLWNIVESAEFANRIPETGSGVLDPSQIPAFQESMRKYHARRTTESYATHGMRGKPHPQKGNPLKANHCPVVCEGTHYESVGAAQEAYPGISIRKRLDNPKYPEFYRLRERTRRPRRT
jgi:hypothetical protein